AVLHRDEGLRALRGLIEDTINRPLAAQVLEGIRHLRAVAQDDTVVIEAVAEV
ncbi:MAG: hypothetical protein HY329_19285, partial [Chloroflexi bacterium]|nr:hypothetical protein [Chloroflexota bacterium]